MWNVWGIFLKSLTLAWFPYRKKKEKERQYLYQYYNIFPAILFNINGKIEIYVLLIITSGKMVIRVFTDLKYMEWLKNFLKISLL